MNLVVAGCSISDRGGATICYGDALSEMLNMSYIHHGSGAGSNDRIWRIITKMVMENKLTSNDQLIVQYTGVNRREFWTCNNPERYIAKVNNQVRLVDDYEPFGYLVKYKNGAHNWQRHKYTKAFFKQYEEEFCNEDYNNECFAYNHYNFSNMLKQNNIKTLFVRLLGFGNDDVEKYSCGFPVLYVNRKMCDPSYLQEDQGHFTDDGHRWVASIIKEKLCE